jgi:hypothetical protein
MKQSIRIKKKRKQTRKKRSKRGGVYNLRPGEYYRLLNQANMPDRSPIQPTEVRFDGMNSDPRFGNKEYIVSVNGYPYNGRYYFGVNRDDIDPTQINIVDRELLRSDPMDVARRRPNVVAMLGPSAEYNRLLRSEHRKLIERNPEINLEEFKVHGRIPFPDHPWFFVPDIVPGRPQSPDSVTERG